MKPPLAKWDPFYEPPFDGVSKISMKLAIATLREASDRFAEAKDNDSAARLDVVARALEKPVSSTSRLATANSAQAL